MDYGKDGSLMRGIKRNFTGGEVAAALAGRDDLTRYQASCAVLENFLPQLHGGARVRPGFRFLDAALGDGVLIPFEFNTDEEDIYVLVFTDLKLRIIQGDGYVLSAGVPLELDTPYFVDDLPGLALGYAQTGDIVYLVHKNHAPRKLVRTSHTSWSLSEIDFSVSESLPFTADAEWEGRTGGDFKQQYLVSTVLQDGRETLPGAPFSEDYCFSPASWQDGEYIDVIWDWFYYDDPEGFYVYKETNGHWGQIGYYENPGKISIRNSSWKWVLSAHGTNEYYLKDASLTASVDTYNTTGTSGQTVITVTGFVLATDIADIKVYIDGTGLPSSDYSRTGSQTITLVTPLSGGEAVKVTSVSRGPYQSLVKLNGALKRFWVQALNVYDQGVWMPQGAPGSLSDGKHGWGDNDSLGFQTIYVRLSDGVDPDTRPLDAVTFDYCRGLLVDDNYTPDTTLAPQKEFNPFENGNNPGVAAFYQQRLWFAGSDKNPATFYASQIGDFENFNRHQSPRDDDSLEFAIASGKISQIKWLIPFSDLLIGTAGAEHRVTGGDYNAITPTNVDCKPQSFWGSGAVRPIVVGNSIVHVQRQSGRVRDLFYSLEKDGYAGNDLSILAGHLFDGHTIRSWAYQQEPESTLWVVRDDGVLLAMTYMKEHDIWGWSKHVTDGAFRWVCTVGGNTEDCLYALVERENGAGTAFNVERLSDRWRREQGIEASFFVDSGLTYSGWNTYVEMTLSLSSAGETWSAGDTVTVTAVGHGPFDSESVGRRYALKQGGDTVWAEITAFVSATVGSARLLSDVPESLRDEPTDMWALMAETLTGLSHLEGKEVVALSDGKPVQGLVVSEGAVTLPEPASLVHVGLPFTGILAPMPFDFDTQSGTTQGHPRSFGQIGLRLLESAGGRVAVGDVHDNRDDLLFDDLMYDVDVYGGPVQPFTGVKTISSPGGVGDELTMCIKQDLPLPFHVLAIVADVDFGG